MILESDKHLEYPRNATLTDLILDYNLGNAAPDRPSIIEGLTGKTLFTYASLRTAIRRVAGHLQHKLRVQRGDVIGIFSTNKPFFPAVVHGILATGGTVSALNPLYQPQEIAHALQLSRPRYIFCEESLAVTLQRAIDAVTDFIPRPIVYIWNPSTTSHESALEFFDAAHLIEHDGAVLRPPSFKVEEIATHPAFICFSSGTSGLVKGVVLTHGNVVANTMQQSIGLRGLFTPSTVFALAVPMFHILGLAGFCCQYIAHGATIVFFERFDFPALVRAIGRDRITHLNVVPPMALEFLRNPAASAGDYTSLQCMMNAAAPLKQEIADLITKKIGCAVTQWYGMTEASPSVMSQREDEVHVTGTVGKLLPGIQLKILQEDGSEADYGQIGEFMIRGPNLMLGYVQGGGTMLSPFSAEGFFPTGDVGYIDRQGFCFLVDRAKEMIKVKGNQVAPAELEALLLTHPLVVDAAVCGMLSEDTTTEIPIAYISAPLASPDSQIQMTDPAALRHFCVELRQWADDKVAPYKRLKGGIHVLPNGVPRNPSGKILRRLLPANLARSAEARMRVPSTAVAVRARL